MLGWRKRATKIDIKQSPLVKHIPQRTCIACRQIKPKRRLIRLVYTVDGRAEVDFSGKKAGRGAYLCCSSVCWQEGLNKGHLEKALRRKISAEDRAKLVEFGKMLSFSSKDNSPQEKGD